MNIPTDDNIKRKRMIWSIVSASAGNLVEWFDFYAYSFTSVYFAGVFFPMGDSTSQLLNTAGVFALGFFMRPVGSWLFGRMSDKRGRRASMMASILMMCFGSLMVACLPTYATAGLWAPALLLVARLIQGLAVGGEYGSSATYMSEVVESNRGFYGSFQYVTLIGGQLLAVSMIAILQVWLTSVELRSWGWRIPFLIGAISAVVALWLRNSMVETSTAAHRAEPGAGTLSSMLEYPRALLIVLGYTAGGSLLFYTFTTYMQKYLINTTHLDPKIATHVMTAGLFCFMVMQPICGWLSDRISRRFSMIIFGVLGMLGTVPVMTAIGRASEPFTAFALVLAAMAVISLYTSISGLIKAEMFPPHIRALAVGLTYAVGNAMFGGTAEYVALWCKASGNESIYFWYVSALAGVALAAAWFMPVRGRGGPFVAVGSEDLPKTAR